MKIVGDDWHNLEIEEISLSLKTFLKIGLIHVYHCRLLVSCFISWILICYCHCHFDLQLSQIWLVGHLPSWLLYSFRCLHPFLSLSYFLVHKDFTGSLYHLLVLVLETTISSRSLLLLVEVVCRNQDLGCIEKPEF